MNGIKRYKSVVLPLVAINVIVFFLQATASYNLTVFALIPSFVAQGYIFQILTYMFLHGGFFHLFINMYILLIFGSMVEDSWGPKKFLIYYFITGVGAGLCIFIMNYFVFPELRFVPTIGASGAIFGLLLAYAVLYPNNVIYLFFIIPIKAKYLVILYGAFELYNLLDGRNTGISHVGHLGGLLFGILYFLFTGKKSKKATKAIKYKITKTIGTPTSSNKIKKEDNVKLNIILNKLEQSGKNSLSDSDYQIINYHNIMNDGKSEISCSLSDFNNADSYCLKCESYTKCILRKINSLIKDNDDDSEDNA